MAADTLDHVGEPGFGLHAVQAACFGKRVKQRRGISAFGGPDEHPVAAPQSNAAQGIFDQVVADLKQAIFAIANHRRPAVEGIATCLRQGAIRRQSLHLGLQPWPQGSQLREGQLLANPASLIGRRSLDIPFDREQFRSAEHTSELQSLMRISYAVFCLKKKKKHKTSHKTSDTTYTNNENRTHTYLL